MQYTLSRAYNDTNGINAFPANDYDLSGEWARADFDRRHRLIVLGRVTAVKWVDLGVSLTVNSGAPYTELLGGDPYHNGRGRARPAGIARNRLEATGYSSLDLRASREFKVGGTRESDPDHDLLARCVQCAEPCELWIVCRHRRLSAWPAGLSARRAPAAAFGSREVLGSSGRGRPGVFQRARPPEQLVEHTIRRHL